MPEVEAIVIGTGPTGLTAALTAARRGPVLVLEPRTYAARVRVDSVPVSLLAFLIELGLHPADLGASMVHDTRLVAWSDAAPAVSRGAGSVHVLRPLLDHALLAKARAHGRITVRRGRLPAGLTARRGIFDATGRRALSAERTVGLEDPAVCRSVLRKGVFAPAQQALRIASLPGGYAYRLGTADVMMVGLVLGRTEWSGAVGSIATRIRRGGAGWLLAGMPAVDDAASGRGGIASVQWSIGTTAVTRLGDADFARDALAGQGIATGISAALRVFDDAGPSGRADPIDDSVRHLDALCQLTIGCRYSDSPFWQSYRRFLSNSGDTMRRRGEERRLLSAGAASKLAGTDDLTKSAAQRVRETR